MKVEGIFRISGQNDQIEAYKSAIDSGINYPDYRALIDITGQEVDFSHCDNPHNVSNLLKLYFRMLPNPLLTYERYDKIISVASGHA